MHELFLTKKKGLIYIPDGAVLAMDFEENTWKDLVNPDRTFGVTGPGATLSTQAFINGKKSYSQEQEFSGASGVLYTPRTEDLTFPGDFWMEMWVFCKGQGSDTFTGGGNQLISYGVYTQNGGLTLFGLSYLKLAFYKPNGTAHQLILTSSIAITNMAWHHCAIGRKDGILYLFINGKVVGSVAYADTFGFGTRMAIGGYFDGRTPNQLAYSGLNGYMDRLRIYNRCLTTTDFVPMK